MTKKQTEHTFEKKRQTGWWGSCICSWNNQQPCSSHKDMQLNNRSVWQSLTVLLCTSSLIIRSLRVLISSFCCASTSWRAFSFVSWAMERFATFSSKFFTFSSCSLSLDCSPSDESSSVPSGNALVISADCACGMRSSNYISPGYMYKSLTITYVCHIQLSKVVQRVQWSMFQLGLEYLRPHMHLFYF